MSTAPSVLPWPFLTVLMASAPATKGSDGPEPPRVRGLGYAFGDHVVTAAHVAEGSDVALFADGNQLTLHADARTYSGVSLVRTAGSWPEPALPVADAAEGQAVTIAVVSDISPSVQLIEGRAGPAGPDGTFTIDLSARLSEDATASGSPVYAEGAIVGIVGPTATSSSVDAIDADALRALLAPPAPPGVTQGAAAQEFDLAGGVSSDLVDPTTGLALDRDRLDVATDVSMFATLITDTETPMPLSIGLFGEWGSGKSTFMALLRHEVKRLSESADPRFRSDVVQIGFNAWHYADSNLWASLGDEIFEQLAGPEGQRTSKDRAVLREALADRLQQRQELVAAANQAGVESARLGRELEDAKRTRRTSARELAAAAVGTPTVRRELDAAFKRMGIGGDDAKVAALAGELAQTPEDVRDVRAAVTAIPLWGWLAALAVGIAAIVAGVVLADWLAGVGAVLVTVLGVAGAVAARVASGARMLHEVAEGLRRRQDEAVADELARLREAETHQRVVQTQLEEVDRQVDELSRELAELTPGRRLYSFIAERAASDAYRGQLGLISTIRKDFEQLAALMKEWREADVKDDAKRPIDRIVLYIDDLDRCSPRQVVAVLQAVHLLLALDLFVVVVGVDPRWLLHSLRREYRSMLTTDARDGDEESRWQTTTPQDYLEKIFNIPFALPTMAPTAFGRLIGSLVEVEPDPAPEPTPPPSTATTPVEAGSEIAQSRASAGDPAPVPIERRPLKREELAMLTALAPLVRTPREAKRLVNLYRMLRATRDLSPAARFLGDESTPGEYQAVVILLGLLSGDGRLMPDVLTALVDADPAQSWTSFIGGLTSANGDADLGRVADDLRGAGELVTISGLAPFQTWGPRIARFSFRGGR